MSQRFSDHERIDSMLQQLVVDEHECDEAIGVIDGSSHPKQGAGFGAFEVRTYTSLIRHWLSSRMAMYFLAAQTQRLRGEKSADHVGAGGRRGQYAGVEDLEPLGALVG